MARVVLLDAGPLSMVTHPRANQEITDWLKHLLLAGTSVLVPEIADYEVRRELVRARKAKSITRLNEFKHTLGYVPITTQAMLKAAEYWAQARNEGYPTAADKALDADVILAAQANTFAEAGDDPIVATTDIGDLTHFVDAQRWEDIY